MFSSFTAYLEFLELGFDAHQVVSLRLMRLAAGGSDARAEAERMVSEKIFAFWQSQAAVGKALASGLDADAAARAGMRPYRRAVRANRRRLSSGK